MSIMGTRVIRTEDPRLLTSGGVCVDDLRTPELAAAARLKLRLAAPEVIIDLGGLQDLSYITDQGAYVAIGALTRYHDVQHSSLLARELPLLAHARALTEASSRA